MVVTIRPASVDDADAIGQVHVRAWHSAYRGVMAIARANERRAR